MKILAVARFTMLRLRRSRYLYATFLLILLVVGSMLLVDQMPESTLSMAHNLSRMIIWLAAIWLGINLVQADRADGTLRSTLTRPISLVEVLAGKLLGGLAYLTLLSIVFTLAIALAGRHINANITWNTALYQIHLLPVHLTVMALAMLLAQVLPRFASGFIMLLAWDHAYSTASVAKVSTHLPLWMADVVGALARVIYMICPPTSTFYLSYSDFARLDLPAVTYLLLLAYAAHYAIACCLLAAWALNRQEL